jgi:hypothetical protein
MIGSAASLEILMRRRIARRLRLARWSQVLLVPTVAAIYFVHRIQWLFLAGIGAIFLEILAIMVGEAQRCPLCDTSLVVWQDRHEEFANACPECGFLID